jgi:hypothetical protein
MTSVRAFFCLVFRVMLLPALLELIPPCLFLFCLFLHGLCGCRQPCLTSLTTHLSASLAVRRVVADGPEARAAVSLLRKLSGAKDKAAMAAAMDTHWRDIYNVADLVAVSRLRRSPITEPCLASHVQWWMWCARSICLSFLHMPGGLLRC